MFDGVTTIGTAGKTLITGRYLLTAFACAGDSSPCNCAIPKFFNCFLQPRFVNSFTAFTVTATVCTNGGNPSTIPIASSIEMNRLLFG